MPDRFVHHLVSCAPRQWQAVADALKAGGAERLAGAGGMLFGAFRSQIGAPRDDLNVITAWPDGSGRVSVAQAEGLLLEGVSDVRSAQSLAMWERSKLPANEAEAEVRRKLSRRYDLCDWTTVYTTTLLTAEDMADEARWA